MVNKHNEEYKSGINLWQKEIDQVADGTMPEKVEIEVYVANDEEWEKYKSDFNKVYKSEDEPLK